MVFHIFLQARQNSTRLPNKILKEICGKSIFELILERLQNINNSKIFLVTGDSDSNKQLIEKSIELGIEYFSGSENNVLDRFFNASKKFNSKKIIRITGDCPLLNYKLINETENIFNSNQNSVITNYLPRTFPHGYDFEIFQSEILDTAWKNVRENFSNENKFLQSIIPPMQYITSSKKFSVYNITNSSDLGFIRLTLDYQEDFELIKKIFEELYTEDHNFDSQQILSLLKKKPELLNLNKNYAEFNQSDLDNFLKN